MEFVLARKMPLLPRLFGLAPLFASAFALAQNVQTQAPCSPVIDRTQGSVSITFSGGCTTGISVAELKEIIDGALARRGIPAELLDRYEMLSQRFGVTDAALGTFFLILGEKKVAAEDLDTKLREVAARHLTLLKQAEPSGDDDPQVAAIKKEAVAAIAVGNYARGEELLQRAFDTDLTAARRAQDAVRRAQDAADKRYLTAAKTRADLGELKLTELRYAAAAEDFQAAANLVPQVELLVRSNYLSSCGQAALRAGNFPLAGTALVEALTIREKLLDPEHLDLANSLNGLADLYRVRGRLAEAEPLYKRALAIGEKVRGPEDPTVAIALNSLALLYENQDRLAEAEPLFKRALAIDEKVLGPEHPSIAIGLNNLAGLHYLQGDFAEAERLYKRAVAIDERAFGPEHPEFATHLNNLAVLYRNMGRLAEAEPLYKRALAIGEKVLGPEHPDVASRLNNLASLYQDQGRLAEAELLYKRALAIGEQVLGPEHPNIATRLNNLASLYRAQGHFAEAEPLLRRALAIDEKVLGPEHRYVVIDLTNLAGIYYAQRRFGEAESLLKRVLSINEKVLGLEHSRTRTIRDDLRALQEMTRNMKPANSGR
jgi:tetratricopeptide (TPR) repeat protein